MKRIILIIFFTIAITAYSDEYETYQVYEKDGSPADFEDIVEDAIDADIVFFGEIHDNSICHWLELQLTKSVYEEKKDMLSLGAEMFETDDQMIIDEYMNDLYSTNNFEKESKIWSNYKTDYKPLLEFAKKNKLRFIATNIPRRYASLVSKNGFASLDSLTPEAKYLIAKLPINADMTLPGYKKMREMGEGHKMNFIAEAQAAKDATMAEFILKHYSAGKTIIHFNGAYHSDRFEGIVWFIKQQRPDLKILTISTVQQEKIDDLEKDYNGLADYILAIPNDMTKTY